MIFGVKLLSLAEFMSTVTYVTTPMDLKSLYLGKMQITVVKEPEQCFYTKRNMAIFEPKFRNALLLSLNSKFSRLEIIFRFFEGHPSKFDTN